VGRFISAVALYGPKTGPVRELLAGVQARIAAHLGDRFRPYSLDQVHATLIALNAVPGPRTGSIVNEYYLTRQDRAVEMDLPLVMDTLAARFARPLRVRIGGWRRDGEVPFTSQGQHLYDRAFSAQGNAFVLVGWPAVSFSGEGGAGREGVGEGGAIPPPAAIFNAVNDALRGLGVELTETPLTPQRLRAALAAAKNAPKNAAGPRSVRAA